MPTTVELPGGDSIEFPDGMSDADINSAVKTHLAGQQPPASPAAPSGEQPGFLSRTWDWLNQPPTPEERSGGLTGAVVRNIPGVGQLPGIAAAALGPGSYRQNLQQQQSDTAAWEKAHPTEASYVAPLLGAALLAPGGSAITKAPEFLPGWFPSGAVPRVAAAAPAAAEPAVTTLPGQIARAAGIGAGFGAATGAENALQDPNAGLTGAGLARTGRDIGTAAGWGAAGGAAAPVVGAALSRPVSGLARAISGALPESWTGAGGVFGSAPEIQAARVAGRRVAEDVGAGGQGVQSLESAIAGVPAGKPMTIADLADPNLQALAGRVARAPGEGRATALNAFGDRTSEASSRIVSDINQGITPETAYGAEQQLLAQRKAAAAPLYDKAYQAAPINPDLVAPGGDLTNLMQRPSMQDATRRALSIAQEEGRNPNSLGITFNDAGDPQFQQVPSWQTLDYVKRGLDDHLDQWRNAVTGRLDLDEAGRASLGTQNAFTDLLDANNPDYAAARAAWAGPTAARGALKQGQNFRSMSPEQLQAQFTGPNAMSPGEQSLFRVGAADTLRQGAATTGDVRGLIGSNAANQRGATYLTDQLRPLFTDDDAFNSFVNRAQSEAKMLETQGRVIGGSPTAARVAEDAGPREGAVMPLAMGTAAIAGGEPFVGIGQLSTGLSRLIRGAGADITAPSVNAALARNLYSTDPAVQRRFLAQMLAVPPPAGQLMAPAAGGLAQQMVPPAAGFVSRYGPLVSMFRPQQEERR